MVWQKGVVAFDQFFRLFLPAIVNWAVPALIMSFFLPAGSPDKLEESIQVKPGGFVVIALFLITITMAVLFHSLLHLPSMLGMMTGLGILKLYGYWLKRTSCRNVNVCREGRDTFEDDTVLVEEPAFDIFHQLQRAEWDTLMFFTG